MHYTGATVRVDGDWVPDLLEVGALAWGGLPEEMRWLLVLRRPLAEFVGGFVGGPVGEALETLCTPRNTPWRSR